MRQPKVLHVISALGLGGVEVWLIALLRYMRERERAGESVEDFHFLMTGGKSAELDEVAKSLGTTLHYIQFSRSDFAGFARKFRALLKREQFPTMSLHLWNRRRQKAPAKAGFQEAKIGGRFGL